MIKRHYKIGFDTIALNKYIYVCMKNNKQYEVSILCENEEKAKEFLVIQNYKIIGQIITLFG